MEGDMEMNGDTEMSHNRHPRNLHSSPYLLTLARPRIRGMNLEHIATAE